MYTMYVQNYLGSSHVLDGVMALTEEIDSFDYFCGRSVGWLVGWLAANGGKTGE